MVRHIDIKLFGANGSVWTCIG